MNSASRPEDINQIRDFFQKDAERKKDFYISETHDQINKKMKKRRMWTSYQRVLTDIIRNHPDISSVCDLGCGIGNFLIELIDRNHFDDIVGVDFLKEALEIAAQQQLISKNVSLLQADLGKLPFKKESFDLVCCLNVLHHFQNKLFTSVIEEISQISKNLIIIEIRNHDYIGDFVYKKIAVPIYYSNLPVYTNTIQNVSDLFETLGFQLTFCRGNKRSLRLSRRLILVFQKRRDTS